MRQVVKRALSVIASESCEREYTDAFGQLSLSLASKIWLSGCLPIFPTLSHSNGERSDRV